MEAETALRYRTAFERLINSTSTRFIHLPVERVDSAIDRVLQEIGEFAGVDRKLCVSLLHRRRNHVQHAMNGAPQESPRCGTASSNWAANSLPWFSERIRRLETVYVPSVAELPPEAEAEQQEWQFEGIQSLVCVPMICFRQPDRVRRLRLRARPRRLGRRILWACCASLAISWPTR